MSDEIEVISDEIEVEIIEEEIIVEIGDGVMIPEWGMISGDIKKQEDLQTALGKKSDIDHVHDDRYYTEQETDALLDQKANTADLGALAAKDKAEWNSDINGIPSTFPPSAHVHDDRYYTEQETDALLDQKANTADLGALAAKDKAEWDSDINGIPSDFPPSAHDHDGRYYTEQETNAFLGAIGDHLTDIDRQLEEIDDATKYRRYGVSGIGQSASALTRLYDAVGMIAQVGTDGDNSAVVNDFDDAAPWKRRKCVGEWSLVDGRAKFTVNAYLGDADYTEDGSMGDYVAVECPLCFYSFDGSTLAISGHKHSGMRAFDIFCRNHNQNDLIENVYIPAYALGVKDGKAVSLPGLDNEQGLYKSLLDKARTYKGGTLGNLAIIQPTAVNFYEWALFTVEFATQNGQSIMAGCCALRSADSISGQFIGDLQHFVTARPTNTTNGYAAAYIAGQRVAITQVTSHVNQSYLATHKVLNVTRCNASGAADPSGTYVNLELEDLGRNYYTYAIGTSYYIASRPYPTGACSSVSTPSGSPVNNTNGLYPMQYRWRENVYSNQFKTVVDLFNKRVGTGDSDWMLEWYLLTDPSQYSPSANDRPNAAELAAAPFEKLEIETAHANYVNGYIKSKKYDEKHPDIGIPFVTTGASTTTFFCDYTYLVSSPAVRAVRFGGHWYHGGNAGFSSLHGNYAPSSGYAYYGADLFFIQ